MSDYGAFEISVANRCAEIAAAEGLEQPDDGWRGYAYQAIMWIARHHAQCDWNRQGTE